MLDELKVPSGFYKGIYCTEQRNNWMRTIAMHGRGLFSFLKKETQWLLSFLFSLPEGIELGTWGTSVSASNRLTTPEEGPVVWTVSC